MIQGGDRKCVERVFTESQNLEPTEASESEIADIVDVCSGEVKYWQPGQVSKYVSFKRLDPVLSQVQLKEVRDDGERVGWDGREPVVVEFEDRQLVEAVEGQRVEDRNLISAEIQVLQLKETQTSF